MLWIGAHSLRTQLLMIKKRLLRIHLNKFLDEVILQCGQLTLIVGMVDLLLIINKYCNTI